MNLTASPATELTSSSSESANSRRMTAPDLPDITSAIAHYHPSDQPVFRAAYRELIGDGLDGKTVLEVCSGLGDLSGWLARYFPTARIISLDWGEGNTAIARDRYGHLKNLECVTGDATDLSRFPDASMDVVVGQATMHHLSNSLAKASEEFSRVLKPGGRCLFIFEPLGHNPFVAAIRSALNSRTQALDEANLYLYALESFAKPFRRYDVQYFNMLGYPTKALSARPMFRGISNSIYRLDAWLFEKFPNLRKHAANCNVIYWK